MSNSLTLSLQSDRIRCEGLGPRGLIRLLLYEGTVTVIPFRNIVHNGITIVRGGNEREIIYDSLLLILNHNSDISLIFVPKR